MNLRKVGEETKTRLHELRPKHHGPIAQCVTWQPKKRAEIRVEGLA